MPTSASPTTLVKGGGICRWNGTDLGYIAEDITVIPGYDIVEVTEESSGTTPVKMIYAGFRGQILFGCQSMNSTVFNLSLLSPVGVGGNINGTYDTGKDLYVSKNGTFTFTPDESRNLGITASCAGVVMGQITYSYREITTHFITLFCTSITIS